MMVELITGGGCPACTIYRQRLKTVIDELDQSRIIYREIDVVEELDYAVELGVLATPAIAINGKLVFTSAPSLKKLRDKLHHYLERPELDSSAG